MASFYNVLKVAPDAPVEVIRAAYRVLAARHHPDRCDGDPQALERMQAVNEAYRVLSDPGLRAQHDALLRCQRRRRAGDGVAPAAAPAGCVDMHDGARRRAVAAYAVYAAARP